MLFDMPEANEERRLPRPGIPESRNATPPGVYSTFSACVSWTLRRRLGPMVEVRCMVL